MNTKNQKGSNSKRKNISRFALIWQDGSFSFGEDFSIAKSYCKRKKLILGLLKLHNRNNLVYSLKIGGQWIQQGTITDSGNIEENRKAAFRDFFRRFLLNNQNGFSIIKLNS